MSFNVQVGEPLILRLTLPEQDDSKFVRAIVKDDTGLSLTGSPFILNNLGDGEYIFKDANNLVFPENKIEVSAIYQIYDDIDFLIPTVDYSQQAEDIFRNLSVQVGGVGDAVLDVIERVEKLVNNSLTLRDDITILIEDDEPVELEVHESEEIEILVSEDN